MLFRRTRTAQSSGKGSVASEEDADVIPFPAEHASPPDEEIPAADAAPSKNSQEFVGADAFESALERYALEGARAVQLHGCIAFTPDGLHFTGAVFDFEIPLASRRLDFALYFEGCVFRRPFDARWAKLDTLVVRDCTLEKEFIGAALDARGNIDFGNTTSKSQIDLSEARIQGDLVLNDAHLSYSRPVYAWWKKSDVRDGTALFCGGMHAHSVFMVKTTSEGRIFLDSARLAGIFKAANATLRRFERRDSDGNLERDKVNGKGERWDHMALTMADAEVHGGVILGEEAWGTPKVPDGFMAVGQVNLSNSQIGGDLVCTNGKFRSAYYDADPKTGVFESFLDKDQPVHNALLVCLNVSRTQIGGGVWLERDFHACGEVRFDASSVRGTFRCTGATFDGALPGCKTEEKDRSKRYYARVAMVLDRIDVGSALMLNNGFIAFGRVSLRNAIIHGDLNCEGGTFHACWHRNLEGELYDDPERQPEALALSGAQISGSVFLTRAANKTDVQSIAHPLIRGSAEHVRMTFRSYGQVRLRGTRIGRNLHLCGGQFDTLPEASEPADNAGNKQKRPKPRKPPAEKLIGWFHSARVEGATFLVEPDRDPVRFKGSVTFAGMETGGWEDSVECWPECGDDGAEKGVTMVLDGLTYKTLHGPMRGEERLMWLLHQPLKDLTSPPGHRSLRRRLMFWKDDVEKRGFKTQPWEQCAQALYELGYHRDARFLFRMEQRFLRLKGKPNWFERLFSFILGTFVGHGYRVFYALLWAVWLIVLGGVFADAGYQSGYIVPAEPEIVAQWLHVPAGGTASQLRNPPLLATRIAPPRGPDGKEPARSPSKQSGYDLPPEYPRFHPLLYAMDIALPAGNLRQADYWIASDIRVEQVPRHNILHSWREKTNRWADSFVEGMPDVGIRNQLGLKLCKSCDVRHADKAILASLIISVLLMSVSLYWAKPWATLEFPGEASRTRRKFSRDDAKALYHGVLDRGRWRPLIAIPPVIVMTMVGFFFFVVALYLLDAMPIFYAIEQLNFLSAQNSSLSFSHMWSAFETLMGWLLITSVGIGLGAVVFRRTES